MQPFMFVNLFGGGQQEMQPPSVGQTGRIFSGGFQDPRQWIQQEQRARPNALVATSQQTEVMRLKEQGNVHFRNERYEEALNSYNLAIRADNTVPQLFANRANTLLKLERPSEALLDADRAIELNPKWARAHFRRGQCMFALQHYTEAIESFKAALKFVTDEGEREDMAKWLAKAESKHITTCAALSNISTPRHLRQPSTPITPIRKVTEEFETSLFNPLEGKEMSAANQRRKILEEAFLTMNGLDSFRKQQHEAKKANIRSDLLSPALDEELTTSFKVFEKAQEALRVASLGEDRDVYQKALVERDRCAETFRKLYTDVMKSLEAMEQRDVTVAGDCDLALATMQAEKAKPIAATLSEVFGSSFRDSDLSRAMLRTNHAMTELRGALEMECQVAALESSVGLLQCSADATRVYQELQQAIKPEEITAFQHISQQRATQLRALRSSYFARMGHYCDEFVASGQETQQLLREEAELESERLSLERRRIKLNAELEWKKVRGVTEVAKDKADIDEVRGMIVGVVSRQTVLQERLQALMASVRPEVQWKTSGAHVTARSRVTRWIKGSGLWLDCSLSDFDSLRVLKTTHESKVYHATLHGQAVAIKEIVISSDKVRSRFQHEIAVVSHMNHPNVIKLRGVFYEGPLAFLVMPYYHEGTLKSYLEREKGKIPMWRLQDLFRLIVSSVAYIHDNGILHRDLKPSNILMENNARSIVVTDFGISKVTKSELGDSSDYTATVTAAGTPVGTHMFMAPEVLSGEPGTFASDMWSLGVMMLQISLQPETEAPVLLPGQPHVIVDHSLVGNERLAQLLEGILQADPKRRLTAYDVLVHPFFTTSLVEEMSDNNAIVESDKKISVFTAHMHAIRIAVPQPTLISISRERIYDSIHEIFEKFDAVALLQPLFVVFRGEEGIDEGGLTAEMFHLYFSTVATDKRMPLFLCADNAQGSGSENEGNTSSLEKEKSIVIGASYLPNPDHTIPLSFFTTFGKVLLKALVSNRPCPFMIAGAVLKYLVGQAPTLADLEEYDPALGKALRRMLLYSPEELNAVGLDFSDIVPGSTQLVDVNNVKDYVQRRVQHVLIGSRKAQLEAIAKGFFSCTPLNAHINILSATELHMLMCGGKHIQPEVIVKSLQFQNFPSSSRTPQLLIDLLQRMTQNSLRRFLRLCTASVTIPHSGLSRPIVVVRAGNLQALPVGHTCSQQIDLPDYNDAEILKTKLYIALAHVNDGFGFQ